MRLVNPVRGSIVETNDPRTISYLRYNKGYWTVGDAASTAVSKQEGDSGPPEQLAEWVDPDDDLQPGPLPE